MGNNCACVEDGDQNYPKHLGDKDLRLRMLIRYLDSGKKSKSSKASSNSSLSKT